MIERYSFGHIVVNGKTYHNDIKIIGAAVIPEWWRKSGHVVSPEDVSDLIDARPDYIVIGRGKPGFMKTSSEVKDLIEDRGITLLEEKTAKAVKIFNQLHQEGKKVCAGFHLSC